jgi:hypothetical protein
LHFGFRARPGEDAFVRYALTFCDIGDESLASLLSPFLDDGSTDDSSDEENPRFDAHKFVKEIGAAQAALVEGLGLGGVFRADDPADCARAVGDVLGRRGELAARVGGDGELRRGFSWAAQAEVLGRVYAEEAAALGREAPGAGGAGT